MCVPCINYINVMNKKYMNKRTISPQGRSWDDVRKNLLTPEELAESKLRVELMVAITEARKKKGITARKLETLSGVRQPVIARIEKGGISTQLNSVLKVLAPLGKTLYVGDLQHA